MVWGSGLGVPKLVGSDRVESISRVGSGSTLWVGVSTQTRPDLSGRVDSDPIGHGLGWVRVVFFRVVSSAAHLTQPIWPSIAICIAKRT